MKDRLDRLEADADRRLGERGQPSIAEKRAMARRIRDDPEMLTLADRVSSAVLAVARDEGIDLATMAGNARATERAIELDPEGVGRAYAILKQMFEAKE